MIVAFNETEKSDAYTFIKEFEASESKAYMDNGHWAVADDHRDRLQYPGCK